MSASTVALFAKPKKKRAKRKRTYTRKAYGAEPRALRRSSAEIIPTAEQRQVISAACDWMLSDDPALSISGSAGTGKSSCLRLIASEAMAKLWTVRLTASTHKAAAAVRDATGLHAETTHRVLGISLQDDQETGELKIRRGKSDLDGRSLLVVDEAYMLPKWMVDAIVREVKKHRCKVLFIGDPHQLAPVKAIASDVFDPERCEWDVLQLTEVHRQAADNPIIAAATAIRLADPQSLPRLESARGPDGHGVIVIDDKREWADLLIRECAKADEENRYLGWTNAAVDAAARAIRREQFGDKALTNPYLPGETLILGERCVVDERLPDHARKGSSTKIILENNDEVIVTGVKQDGPWYWLRVQAGDEEVLLLAMGSYAERERHLMQFRGKALRATPGKEQKKAWVEFFGQRDSIADVRPAQAGTVHKAQGQTLDSVFLNAEELGKCRDPRERQRLWYVAVTRASKSVYVYGGAR